MTSVRSRDKTWFLMRRGGQQYRVEAPGEFGEEAVQEALLSLGAVNSLESAEGAIRDVYSSCFTNVTDIVLYLLRSEPGELTSADGLAGAVHSVPGTGITGSCLERRRGDVVQSISEDDPICGLLEGETLPLRDNRRVVCSVVKQPNGDRVSCLVVIVCDCPTEAELQRLALVERHVSIEPLIHCLMCPHPLFHASFLKKKEHKPIPKQNTLPSESFEKLLWKYSV
ncbi:uncharacterized protein [Diadema antillarum]|uniref:uncharacterized protein isoform X2 n=1 Tax=Diadema antillarum TaxID=105358 RepID=UPI003A845F7B